MSYFFKELLFALVDCVCVVLVFVYTLIVFRWILRGPSLVRLFFLFCLWNCFSVDFEVSLAC